MTREEALALMHEHTRSSSLRQHMLAVEAAMRAYAEKHGEDQETWGMVGLLHDFDYEKFPNHERSPTDGHPSWGVRLVQHIAFVVQALRPAEGALGLGAQAAVG